MEMHLDITETLSLRSSRVKCTELHESRPWMLTALYNGSVLILDIAGEVSKVVADIKICDVPVRCARFIPGQSMIIAASDDGYIRIFAIGTGKKLGEVVAHQDYIRSVAVHPTEAQVLSACDDGIIQLWEWSFAAGQEDAVLRLKQTVGEHLHYVMACQWDPRSPSCLASCSLDKTIRLWDLSESRATDARQPIVELVGHESGVTCMEYAQSHHKPMIVSGSDDRTVRLWDLEAKACLAVLLGHTHNLTAVIFHPVLPLVITGGEDETVRIWSTETLQCVEVLHDDLHRVWALAVARDGSGLAAVGYDDGAVVREIAMPVIVLTLHVKEDDTGAAAAELLLACVSVAGVERSTIRVDKDSTFATFRQAAAEALGQPVWRLRFVLPKGRLLVHTDDVTPMEQLLFPN